MSKEAVKENEQINPLFDNEIKNNQEKLSENTLNKNILENSTKMISMQEGFKLIQKKRKKKFKRIKKNFTRSKTQKTIDIGIQTINNFILDEEDPEEEKMLIELLSKNKGK